MAVIVSAYKIAKSFGVQTLFEDLSFSVESGQKIGLIGPNGAGKSTLLQIIARNQTPDHGDLSFSNQIRVGYLEQNPQFDKSAKLYESIISGTDDPYEYENILIAQEMISRLELDQFDENTPLGELSGGWKKRAALARELVKKPNILLLDEPTNHLDLKSIMWLEDFLAKQNQLASLMVTHDRLFLQNTCDFIFDLDRRNPDGLIKFSGSYSDFVDFKEAGLDAQRNLESAKKNTLRRETEWLRRGAKARQTKQKARIERAGDLNSEVQDLRERNSNKKIQLDFGEVGRAPKKILEAKSISKDLGGRTLFENFSFVLGPKTRLGILGNNGCGKSTLIRTLLGDIQPDSGSVWLTDQMTISYFEQNKDTLNLEISVLKNICPDGDYVQVQGKPMYAKSYLSKFRFRNDQMDMPVKKLSGGEQSRLLIAKLMMNKDQVLVLDEPTNDLDIDTLNILESALKDFEGAIILVTHDRYFMDQVSNQILAFIEDSTELITFSSFLQWQDYQSQKKPAPSPSKAKPAESPAVSTKPKLKLSYKDQRDLEKMEENIQKAESKLSEIQSQLVLPENRSQFAKLAELTKALEAQQSEIETLYKRWQTLTAE